MNIDAIKRGLTDEELVFFEADAAAAGMTEAEYAAMCIRKGLRAYASGELDLEDMLSRH
jgi:hypothetical protein